MTKRSYYGRCVTVAFGGAWSTTNAVSAILGLVLPLTVIFAKRYWPAVENIVPDLAWQIPLAVLSLLFAARIFLAPYWIAEEQEQKTEKLRKELDQVPILNQRLTAKNEDIEHLKDQLTTTMITTSDELAAVFRESFISERITASQFENNAITLQYTPIPQSVELIIYNGTYVAGNTEAISVQGRKILIKNAPKDIQLLDILRDHFPTGSITAKYHRLFSAEEFEETKRRR